MVPTVTAADGQWLAHGPLSPVLKPGGHGAIWKLASDEGVMDWFESKGREAALVRQIRWEVGEEGADGNCRLHRDE